MMRQLLLLLLLFLLLLLIFTGSTPVAVADPEAADLTNICYQGYECFKQPKDCVIATSIPASGQPCQAMAAFKKLDADHVEIRLLRYGPSTLSYVALGLSDDKQMGGDLVFMCKVRGDGKEDKLLLMHNSGRKPEVLPSSPRAALISGSSVRTVDKWVECTAKVKLAPDPPITNEKVLPLDQPYHLLLAWGSTDESYTPKYHNTNTWVSDTKYRLCGCQSIQAGETNEQTKNEDEDTPEESNGTNTNVTSTSSKTTTTTTDEKAADETKAKATEAPDAAPAIKTCTAGIILGFVAAALLMA